MTSVSLLVTSGSCVGNAVCPTEVINFDRQTKTCYSLPDYPENVFGATGRLIGNDTYVSCGGYIIGMHGPRTDKCYKFGSITPIATMRKSKNYAASVVIENKLWVVGGIQEDDYSNLYYLNSTEFVEPANGRVQPGPDLPKRKYAACILKMNSTSVFLIGGWPDPQETWLYNFGMEDPVWERGKDLNTGRDKHACGIVKDSADESKTIVIVAGKNSHIHTKVYIYTLYIHQCIHYRHRHLDIYIDIGQDSVWQSHR